MHGILQIPMKKLNMSVLAKHLMQLGLFEYRSMKATKRKRGFKAISINI